MADAVAVVDARAAERGRVDLLAERLADDPRAGQEHRRVLGHHDQIGQRRRVRAAAGRGAGHDRDLRERRRSARPSRGRSARSRRARRCPPASGRRPTRRTRRPGSARAPRSAARARSCPRGARRASRRGTCRPVRSRRSDARRPCRSRRRRRRRGTAREPRRGEMTRERSTCTLPGSHSASSRSSGAARRTGASGAVTAITDAPRSTSATLCPPNANEFEIATGGPPLAASSGRASPGT